MDQVSQTERVEHARTVHAEARAAVLRMELLVVDARRRLAVAQEEERVAADLLARAEGRGS